MIEIVQPKNGIPIRLTDERWTHIAGEHCESAGMRLEVLETVANPDRILAGNNQESFAVREIEKVKFLVVIYRELPEDGFVITAFLTRRLRLLNRRKAAWSL